LMPGAAAGRRSGKRIRGNLLRAGVLRAVITLAPAGPDLWLLRRPAPGERAPSTLLLGESGPDLSTVDELWQEFTKTPESGTRIIDLLDDDIDLTPALHRAGPPDPAQEFLALQEKFASMALVPPRLSEDEAEPAYTTIGELAKAGVVEVRHAPAKTTPGEETLLTVDD